MRQLNLDRARKRDKATAAFRRRRLRFSSIPPVFAYFAQLLARDANAGLDAVSESSREAFVTAPPFLAAAAKGGAAPLQAA